MRDGRIHTTLLSYKPTEEFDGFETKEIALNEMNEIVDLVVKKYDEEYINKIDTEKSPN